MTPIRVLAAVLACLLASPNPVAAIRADRDELPPPAEGTIAFARDIAPIFARSCLRCHSAPRPDVYRSANQGGLDLSTRAAAMKGGNHGAVIVPGNSAESRLLHLVAGHEDAATQTPAMPPREQDRLTRTQVRKLRAWIDQGAPWPE